MTYAFDNAWQHARQRLALLEQCLDPASFRRLESIGLSEKWTCLEAGAGGGSVAHWLSAKVGPAGRVVATDIDTRFLDQLNEPNLEVVRLDLTTGTLPQKTFDLVHTRMVLMHIPSREDILEKLVAALKPGGCLIVEEQDIYPVLVTASGPYSRVWSAFEQAMAAKGVARDWARNLPRVLAGLGLHNVEAEAIVSMFPGASPMAEFWSLTWKQVREHLDAPLGGSATLDEALKMLEDSSNWFTGPAVVAAWGRR
jgi:2-polyprenyl-3-methyl-5-hydroxy-6-metoxy-1,4-benzoquinol methylase